MTALRRGARLAVVAGLSLLLCVALAGAKSKPRAQAAIAHSIVRDAQVELGRHVHEVPDGSNNSRAIARYRTATVGAMRGAPWCAYFVSYIAKKAGVPIGWHGEGMGYVPYIRDWARKTGRWSKTPRPSYLITFPQHVGIVEHVYSNHTLTSIEGNTSNAVLRRYHRWSEAVGYVKLATGGGIETPAAPHPQTTTVKGQKLVARIRVYPNANAAIGERLDFSAQDSSGPITKYSWDFDGDGRWDSHSPNASHAWQRAGTYKVKLQVSDAAHHTKSAATKVTVHANQPPSAALSLSSSSVHVGDQVRMDASASRDADGHIVKYEWDYAGDGAFVAGSSHATHTYAQAGTYLVRVRTTDDSGNTAEATQQLTVAAYSPPVAAASCDRTAVTVGQSLHCTSDDSRSPYRIRNHDWDIQSDGQYDLHGTSVSFSYSQAGSYMVHLRVTDFNGSTAETDVPVRVVASNQAPTARITLPATANINAPATFGGSGSSDPDGTIVRYDWDLDGNGSYESTGASPTFTYGATGQYTIKLKVTDDMGATATTTAVLTVRDPSDLPPIAQLTLPLNAYAGVSATLSASGSSDPDGRITKYQWDFEGDGVIDKTTTTASTAKAFATAGWYLVTLTVVDNSWSQTTTSAWLHVN